jgi:pimeloyl-ACP methyl ester carboxylesterase
MTQPRLVQTRLGRLAVREYGQGAVAVLWHGMFVDSSSWSRMIEPLSRHRRLLVVDGPGYGASDELARVTTMTRCAGAAADLLDGLGITEPVDWVGNAWGGHVGYELDAAHPGRIGSLVAISAPSECLTPRQRMKLRMLRPVLRAAGAAPFLVAIVAEAQLTDYSRAADPDAIAVIRDSMRRQSKRSLSTTFASFVIRRRDLKTALCAGTAPALFIASDDRGEWTPALAKATAGQRAGARSTTVSWSRTLVPLEQPAALAREIVAFWEELAR